MTTPSQDPTWTADWNQLQTDIANAQAVQTEYEQSIETYHEEMEKIEKESNPMVAFTLLACLLAGPGSSQLNNQTAVFGSSLKVQGDVTTLSNDLQNLTNRGGDAASGTDPYYMSYTKWVANESNQMAQALNSSSGPLSGILGSQAAGDLGEQFQAIRNQIYDTDPNDGPNGPSAGWQFIAQGSSDPTPAPGLITNYSSDPASSGASYGGLQYDLQQPGDPQNANGAEKTKTDAFNQITSTTQSTNAASQEQISNVANVEKTVQSFEKDMMSDIIGVVTAATNNQTKGIS